MNRAAAFFVTLYTTLGDRFDGRKDRGATAVEYGLMVGLIAVAIIVGVSLLGDQLGILFDNIGKKIQGVAGEAA